LHGARRLSGQHTGERGRRADAVAWTIEVRVVEGVEGLPADLKAMALGEVEILEQTEVLTLEAVGVEVVNSSVAESVESGFDKARGVKPAEAGALARGQIAVAVACGGKMRQLRRGTLSSNGDESGRTTSEMVD